MTNSTFQIALTTTTTTNNLNTSQATTTMIHRDMDQNLQLLTAPILNFFCFFVALLYLFFYVAYYNRVLGQSLE